MPLDIDPYILSTVQLVYTTDLGLPHEWTDERRKEFIDSESGKITWMVRAQAGTFGDRNVAQWVQKHRTYPNLLFQNALRIAALIEAMQSVLDAELYELVATDID